MSQPKEKLENIQDGIEYLEMLSFSNGYKTVSVSLKIASLVVSFKKQEIKNCNEFIEHLDQAYASLKNKLKDFCNG